MEVSSTSNSAYNRPVTPSKDSSDRQTSEANQTKAFERKAEEKALQQQAIQEKNQQRKEETQRRLDGRLISFGNEKSDNVASQQQQNSVNRSRVKEAYSSPSPPPTETKNNQSSDNYERDAIDIVV